LLIIFLSHTSQTFQKRKLKGMSSIMKKTNNKNRLLNSINISPIVTIVSLQALLKLRNSVIQQHCNEEKYEKAEPTKQKIPTTTSRKVFLVYAKDCNAAHMYNTHFV